MSNTPSARIVVGGLGAKVKKPSLFRNVAFFGVWDLLKGITREKVDTDFGLADMDFGLADADFGLAETE